MKQSLLFIPDISGFTQFVQTTEVAHSQHVIAELLEVLVSANIDKLELAEIEGDALFFFKTDEVPSQERLLAQFERMYTAFYAHLEKLDKNRICPCNACATAHKLELKIVAHSGDLQFLQVQGRSKPFGQAVIEAHRLLKNSINSARYALISKPLAETIGLSTNYSSKLYHFEQGSDHYDGKELAYLYSEINRQNLNTKLEEPALVFTPKSDPSFSFEKQLNAPAEKVLELVTNYANRHLWVDGVDSFEFNPNEVTRLNTEHLCIIDGKNLNFVTVGMPAPGYKYVYGELTSDAPFADKFYQFYMLNPISEQRCALRVEAYLQTRNPIKELMLKLFVKKAFAKNSHKTIDALATLIDQTNTRIQ